MNFKDLPKHHAILFVTSSRDECSQRFFSELQGLSHIHRYFNQTILDIETARTIVSWSQAPYNNQEKVAVISFHSAGIEAQNTLLKILEEPQTGVRFLLVTSNRSGLIDTVVSRVHVICEHENFEELPFADAKLFLSTSHALRMKLPCITKLLSQLDEEGRKDREGVRAFILEIVTVLGRSKIQKRYLDETLAMASYSADPSASGKALLEYLSLLLPQVSK